MRTTTIAVLLSFVLQGIGLSQVNQLSTTTSPSCPDLKNGSVLIFPSQDLQDDYTPIWDWTIEYKNTHTGEYYGIRRVFVSLSPTIPIVLTGLNPGLFEATLYLDAEKECRINFDFFVDIAQGCPCPELIDELIVGHSCGAGAGMAEVIVGEFEPDRQLSIEWSDGQLSNILQRPFYTGTHQVTVSDIYGCSEIRDFMIDAISGLNIAFISNDIGDACGNDGYVDINPIVLTPANFYSDNMELNYLWSNGARTEDVYDLAAGNYCVTISLGLGNDCQEVQCYDVMAAQADPVCLDQTIIDVVQPIDIGSDVGSISITPYGGSFPYEIIWNDGSVELQRESLSSGTYCYTLTDGTCCEKMGCEEILCNEQNGEFELEIQHICFPDPYSGYAKLLGIIDGDGNPIPVDYSKVRWNHHLYGQDGGQEYMSNRDIIFGVEYTVDDNCVLKDWSRIFDFELNVGIEKVQEYKSCDLVGGDFDENDSVVEITSDICCEEQSGIVQAYLRTGNLQIDHIEWVNLETQQVVGTGETLEFNEPYRYLTANAEVSIPDGVLEGSINRSCTFTVPYVIEFPVNEPIFVLEKNPSCQGFNTGSLEVIINNPDNLQVSVYFEHDSNCQDCSYPIDLETGSNENPAVFRQSKLYGERTYSYIIVIGDCSYSLEVNVGEKDLKKRYIDYDDMGNWEFHCLYEEYCEDNGVALPNIERRRAQIDDLTGQGECKGFFDDGYFERRRCPGRIRYSCYDYETEDFVEIASRKAEVRTLRYFEWIEYLVSRGVFFDENRIEQLVSNIIPEKVPCIKMKFCDNDPFWCAEAADYTGPGRLDFFETTEDGCVRVRCQYGLNLFGWRPGFSYIVCPDGVFPDYISVYLTNPNDVPNEDPECTQVTKNAAFLLCQLNELNLQYGDYGEFQWLKNLLISNYGNLNLICADITYCLETGQLLNHNINEVECLDCADLINSGVNAQRYTVKCRDNSSGEEYYVEGDEIVCGPGLRGDTSNHVFSSISLSKEKDANIDVKYIDSEGNIQVESSNKNEEWRNRPFEVILTPNPTNNYVYVSCTRPYGSENPLILSVTNIMGQLVIENKKVLDFVPRIDLRQLESGWYIFTFSTFSGEMSTSKILITR